VHDQREAHPVRARQARLLRAYTPAGADRGLAAEVSVTETTSKVMMETPRLPPSSRRQKPAASFAWGDFAETQTAPVNDDETGKPVPKLVARGVGESADQMLTSNPRGLRSAQAVRQSGNCLRAVNPDVSNQPSNNGPRRRRTPVDVSGPYTVAQGKDTKARTVDEVP
jgi:hypothetical protein